MRACPVWIAALVVCPRAYADDAGAVIAPELLDYMADAEARAIAEPETIVVNGTTPVDTPSAGVRAVTSHELELTPHKNADDLLRVVPGLYTSQHGSEGKGQQFFLRGFDAVHGADLSIRVGGIPINELSNVHGQGYADLGFVIPGTVSGLTSRKGPFDLEQGWFATAGSIDLNLGAATRGRRAMYEVGTTNRHRIVLLDAPEGRPQGELVAAEILHDDGYGTGRGTQKGSVIGQSELSVGRLRLRPLFAGNWSTFGEPGVVPVADIKSGYFDRGSAPAGTLGGTSRRVLGGLGLEWHKGDSEVAATAHLGWRSLELAENFTGFLENPVDGDARSQRHRAVTGGGRLAWRHRASSWLRLLTGVEVLRDQIAQGEDRISTTGMVWSNERALDARTTSAGMWAGGEARYHRWIFVGGTRLDTLSVDANDRLDAERSGDGRVHAFSPRASLAWCSPRWMLSASAGRGVRPPEARAFTTRTSRENMDTAVFDGGDPEITRADALELGGERRFEHIVIGAAGFATWIGRESVFDHVSGVNALRGASRRVGGELFVAVAPWPWLALRSDLTITEARFITGEPVPGAPRVLASGEARMSTGRWNAGLVGRILGPRPLLHGATAAPSAVLDAIGSWQRASWSLTLQIDNVLASEWNEGEYHFASHWDPSAQASALPRVHISPGRPFGVRAAATLNF